MLGISEASQRKLVIPTLNSAEFESNNIYSILLETKLFAEANKDIQIYFVEEYFLKIPVDILGVFKKYLRKHLTQSNIHIIGFEVVLPSYFGYWDVSDNLFVLPYTSEESYQRFINLEGVKTYTKIFTAENLSKAKLKLKETNEIAIFNSRAGNRRIDNAKRQAVRG